MKNILRFEKNMHLSTSALKIGLNNLTVIKCHFPDVNHKRDTHLLRLFVLFYLSSIYFLIAVCLYGFNLRDLIAYIRVKKVWRIAIEFTLD